MIFRKNVVIEMNGKLMKFNEDDVCENVEYLESSNKFNIITDIKRRNLYVIIDGNEIYVKHMSLPSVKKRETEKLIYNELKYYISDMENVIFSYHVDRVHDKIQEISVFCLNWNKLKVFKYLLQNGNKIKAVYLIQFCFLSYFKDAITSDKFIFVFEYADTIYLIYCNENNMCENRILDRVDEKYKVCNIIEFVNGIHDEYRDEGLNDVYVANSSICDELKNTLINYNIIELGPVSKENIIKSIR